MLYTKKGDKGTTKLFNCLDGKRLSKSEFVFEALGSLDELNSSLGYAKALSVSEEVFLYAKKKIKYGEVIGKIQNILFSVQAEVGGAGVSATESNVLYLEEIIEDVETIIPPIHSFVIVGGSLSGGYLDVCRTLARKAERNLVILKEKKVHINESSLKFLNRLSSALYAMARMADYQLGSSFKSPKYN